MPGIVVFRRRWSVGSDDLVVPGVFLFTMHLIWTVVLTALLIMIKFDTSKECILQLWQFILGYLVVLGLSLLTECAICIVAMRGSILDTTPRASMQYLLYVRLIIMLSEGALLTIGIVWLVYHYNECPIEGAKETLLGLVVCNWCVLATVLITVWCTYDSAGRSWVKMKQFQRSMKESESRFQYKRSGNRNRNWRQRKVIRAYQDSWDQRCRFLFCCMRPSDRNRNSFADIARLLSDFFRDLDVVPSDVIAGLVLLRKFQKIEQKAIVEQRKNDTYEFLSGVAVTPRTQFLALHESSSDLELFNIVIHYMHFALGAYGWPVFLMTYSSTGICQLCTKIRCCCIPCCTSAKDSAEIVADNCCKCNFAAMQKILTKGDIEIVYVTYHVDVGETPFYVAIDYDQKKIIVSIRGTLSMKDVLTDLNAEGDTLPLNPPKEDWTGHKGMIQAAEYIRDKLRDEQLLEKAFNHNPERGTKEFGIVLVGHSLGAGTASILAILMKQEYPDLQCFSYSPPGGLLSMPAVEYTKSFITSVVVGKDVVPRIGLHQMEALRADLINAIKRSVDPKWKTITCSVVCCGCAPEPTSAHELEATDSNILEYMADKEGARAMGVHPSDSTIALTLHNPLFPPGKIIHIVRHHPKKGEQKYEKRWRQAISSHEPVYQALWAQNTDFDEVLISPVMIQDHMPDKVLDALNKVVTTFGPKKPQRNPGSISGVEDSEHCQLLAGLPTSPKLSTQQKLCLETSFTSLQTPSVEANSSSLNSSITNGYHSSKSQTSPIQLTSIITLLDEKLKHRHVPERRTMSLNLKFTSKKIDLIYDDWFGLAPLASPESLSEVSSISSRASFAHLPTNLTEVLSGSYEMRTPKVMRRTPKITGGLSTCADDLKSVRYFQKLGQNSKVLRSTSSQNGSYTSSGDLSYESATSVSLNHCCSKDEQFVATKKCCEIEEENLVPEVHIKECQTSGSSYSGSFQSAENTLESSSNNGKETKTKTIYMETHFDEEIFRPQFSGTPHLRSPAAHLELKQSTFTPAKTSLRSPGVSGTLSELKQDFFRFKTCGKPLEDTQQYSFRPEASASSNLQSPGVTLDIKQDLFRPESSGRPHLRSPNIAGTHLELKPDAYRSNTSSRSNLRSPVTPGTPLDIKQYIPGFSATGIKSTSPQIRSPSTPQEIDPDMMANFAMDLNLEEENRSMQFSTPVLIKLDEVPTKANSVDSGSICRTPSESRNVTFNPQVINIDPKFVSRTSPVSSVEDSPSKSSRWLSRKTEKWHLLPGRKSKSAKIASSPCHFKRRHNDDECFSKNESLPLLSGLSGANSEKTSPNFVRRKKYVYPITSIGKGESSV